MAYQFNSLLSSGFQLSQIEFYNSNTDFPIVGKLNNLYLVRDTGNLFYWYEGLYKVINTENSESSTPTISSLDFSKSTNSQYLSLI